MSEWGDRIKARRIELGMSQVDLASACNLRPPSVNDWESGKTKNIEGANLLNAARHLGVSPEWVIFGRKSKETAIAPSQPERLNSEMLAATHRLLREAHKDAGKTYSVEADPDLFSVVYERLRGLGPALSPTKLADVRSQIDAEISDGRAKQSQRTSRPDSGSGKKRSTA